MACQGPVSGPDESKTELQPAAGSSFQQVWSFCRGCLSSVKKEENRETTGAAVAVMEALKQSGHQAGLHSTMPTDGSSFNLQTNPPDPSPT